ncbi:MAG: THUMP domain-containing protein, partial [Saprospiraceae bacterium]|nr:THUMP domain-containing protein [Saprospiraceae bacterium]
MKLIAKTLEGLEEVLAGELSDLGASRTSLLKRAVEFEGDLALMYRANLCSRTALRILMPIHSFDARNEDQLYRQVGKVDWSQYLELHETFAIDSVVHSSRFTHSHYAALKAKDAIVDQFRRRTGKRPSIDVKSPTLRINLHIRENDVNLLLDSSGDSLHLRNYRRDSISAPLNEVLAAGMIRLSGWKGDRPFLDPMCGSGTLAIEAAMMAANIPPQRQRRNFGFRNWKNYDRELWKKIKKEAEDAITTDLPPIV